MFDAHQEPQSLVICHLCCRTSSCETDERHVRQHDSRAHGVIDSSPGACVPGYYEDQVVVWHSLALSIVWIAFTVDAAVPSDCTRIHYE